MKMDWSKEENINKLRGQLEIRPHKSAEQIAQFFKVTRSSIIGAIHRLNKSGKLDLKLKPSKGGHKMHRRKSTFVPRRLPKVTTPPLLPALPLYVAPESLESFNRSREGIPIWQLEDDTCHWIVCDDPVRYCGAETDERSPYCTAHRAFKRRKEYAGTKLESR